MIFAAVVRASLRSGYALCVTPQRPRFTITSDRCSTRRERNAVQTKPATSDATTVRMFRRSIVESAGFFVEDATNGLEALERAIVASPPNLLLVDVNMPRMDVYAFLRAVWAEPALRSIPAIVISTEREDCDA